MLTNGKVRPSGGAATRVRRRSVGGAAAAAVLASTLAACGGGQGAGFGPLPDRYHHPESRGHAHIRGPGPAEADGG